MSARLVPTPPATSIDRDRDRRLLAGVAQGEARAIRRLLDQHAERATSVVTRVLRDRRDVEEIVQETFVEVWQRARRFDARKGSAAAWVTTIARSRAIDRLRANARASRALDAANADLEPLAAPPPDELLDLRREDQRVHAALDALAPKQHAVIQLAFWGELNQVEIAREIGAPLGTVKLRLRTALANLSRLLRGSRSARYARPRPASGAGFTSRQRAATGRYR
jgi:RNA polymerase sigma-70 factor (ECF subfamily)